MVASAEVFLFSSALALSGGAVGNVLIPSLIKRHFPGRTGTMTTVYTTALAVGTMLAAAATVPIERAADGNWQLPSGCGRRWPLSPPFRGLRCRAVSRSGTAQAGMLGPRTLIRSKLAWSVAAYFGTQSMVAYIMFGFLPKILIDGGYTTGQAGLVLGVFTAIGIPVSLVVPGSRRSSPTSGPWGGVRGLLHGRLPRPLARARLPAWIFALLVGVGMDPSRSR